MAKWLEQGSQWHEMYCHDLEVMSLNPAWVELGVRSTSFLNHTWTEHIIKLLKLRREKNLTSAWVIIKVSGHQHKWLAGGYNLEIGLFRGG